MIKLFEQIPTAPEGIALTDIYEESAQFPGAALLNEQMYIHYQGFKNRHDELKVGRLGENGLEEVESISGKGEVLYPVSLSADDSLWYAWSETKCGGWKICAKNLKNGQWSETIVVDEGEAVLYPNLFTYQGNVYICWTRQHKNAAEAVMKNLSEMGEPEVISVVGEAYRINGCEGGDGNLYVTYDAYEESAYHAFARVKTASGWSKEVQLDNTSHWVCEPRIMRTASGATVCWHTFDYNAKFTLCSADLAVENGTLTVGEPEVIVDSTGWYMNTAVAADKNGLQVLAYTWGKDYIQVRFRKNQEAWSDPAKMSYEDIHCAVHPSLLIQDDIIYMSWQFSHRNGHYNRNSKAVVTRFTTEDIVKRADPSIESVYNTFYVPIAAEKHFDRRTDEEVAAWMEKNGYTGKLLFGDIHGQSGISDGVGTIDQYYRRSRAKADLQISCLTDHDCYPDWISQSEWELMRTTADLMNTDNELTCLLSFEWTPNEYQYDFGHKNVYYRDNEGDIFRSGDKSGITPTDFYASIKNYKGMCIPHHPAADWGMVSAATDWSFHDDEVERLVEIMSRHAPYEDYESQSIYAKNIKKMPRRSVQDALVRGYRMGFTAGSDSHQMDHGLEGGIVAVYVKEHNRESVWDGMYARQTYGTTGARILVSFKANGKPMGSELKMAKGEAVNLEISILGTDELKVDLLKNNKVIQSWEPGCDACDVKFSDVSSNETDYYYVRVSQKDEHMAWGSPIWIDRI